MWVEFVVGYRFVPRVFLQVLWFSPLHKKPTLLISNPIWMLNRATSLLAHGYYVQPCPNKVFIIIFTPANPPSCWGKGVLNTGFMLFLLSFQSPLLYMAFSTTFCSFSLPYIAPLHLKTVKSVLGLGHYLASFFVKVEVTNLFCTVNVIFHYFPQPIPQFI